MARLSVSFDDIWANVDFPDQITLGNSITFAKTTNSPGDIGIALSIYSPDIYLIPDAQGPGIDRHKLSLQIDFSATSTSFSVPLSSWSQVTNKNKITFQIEATAVTTSGVGTTARTTVYAVADQSMAPMFNLSVSPSTGAIQGVTTVSISISGESFKYGASVASRSINADGRSSGGSSLSITPISNGAIAASATVKDSRGLSTTKTATFSVTAYSPPVLRSFNVARVNSSGAADPEGTSVRFSVVWESGSGDTGSNTCTVKYRRAGVGAYVDCGEVISGEEYGITGVAFSTDYEYEFIVVIADKHRPIEKSVTLERGFFTLDFLAGGDGMAIGQACTEPGLTINMPTKFKKPISEISFDDTGANGGWIGAKTQFDKVPIHFNVPHKVDGSRFDPLIAGKDVNGNYWAFGQGAGQEICFVGFKAGRTENGIDWKVSINTLTGVISAPGLSLAAYPVGAVYVSNNSTSPASLFGGSWTPVDGVFPRFSAFSEGIKNGGSNTHTLTTTEMPSHAHTIRTNDGTNTWPRYYKTNAKAGDLWNLLAWNSSNTGGNGQPYLTNTGGGGAHNNVPYYRTFYAWIRTA